MLLVAVSIIAPYPTSHRSASFPCSPFRLSPASRLSFANPIATRYTLLCPLDCAVSRFAGISGASVLLCSPVTQRHKFVRRRQKRLRSLLRSRRRVTRYIGYVTQRPSNSSKPARRLRSYWPPSRYSLSASNELVYRPSYTCRLYIATAAAAAAAARRG